MNCCSYECMYNTGNGFCERANELSLDDNGQCSLFRLPYSMPMTHSPYLIDSMLNGDSENTRDILECISEPKAIKKKIKADHIDFNAGMTKIMEISTLSKIFTDSIKELIDKGYNISMWRDNISLGNLTIRIADNNYTFMYSIEYSEYGTSDWYREAISKLVDIKKKLSSLNNVSR